MQRTSQQRTMSDPNIPLQQKSRDNRGSLGEVETPKERKLQDVEDFEDDLEDVDENVHLLNVRASRRWKIPKPESAIMIAVSSRVLFDMRDEYGIYKEKGLQAYIDYIVENENKPLKPGSAFPFIHALHYINMKLLELDPQEKHLFDVVLMSNTSAQCGISLINSVNHHKLTVERFCLTNGRSVSGYLAAYGTDLYLSANESSVAEAIGRGIAAATLYTDFDEGKVVDREHELRIAFDGDAVLFSDESELIAKQGGLENFFKHEENKANESLESGPLKRFAMQLGEVKKKFCESDECPIRTYLVTARSAASSGIRALRTLRRWGLDIDEALFLAGAPKGPILKKIKPHLFFDDQQRNIASGLEHGVNAAYVPYGIAHELRKKRQAAEEASATAASAASAANAGTNK